MVIDMNIFTLLFPSFGRRLVLEELVALGGLRGQGGYLSISTDAENRLPDDQHASLKGGTNDQ